MRNRAKCKLCKSIIESFFRNDYVACTCGEIAISGGNQALEVYAKNFENFLRVDDDDKEIAVNVVDSNEENIANVDFEKSSLSKKDLVDVLDEMLKSSENLPKHVLETPVNHYDLYSFMSLVCSIFKKDIK